MTREPGAAFNSETRTASREGERHRPKTRSSRRTFGAVAERSVDTAFETGCNDETDR
jgi:hypothetical protein